jgi:hypothetical protein
MFCKLRILQKSSYTLAVKPIPVGFKISSEKNFTGSIVSSFTLSY